MSAKFSSAPGAAALLKGMTAKQYFTRGEYVVVELIVRANTPGRADGRVVLRIDGVKVLDAGNVRFRERATDLFTRTDVVGMYGGEKPPARSFGLQVDDVSLSAAPPPGWA